MRITLVLCLCLLLSLCSLQVVAQVYGSWTLVAGASDGFADANWQCASGNGLTCSTYKNPNNAQNIPSISLSSTYVKFPACAPNQVLPYSTGSSPILWPSINYQTVTPDCYTIYITGTTPTFSIYKSVNPMPSLKFVPSSADVMVEQMSGPMVMPYLYVNTNDDRKVTVAGSDSITIQSLSFTRPYLFTFQKSRSNTTGVVSVAISNVTIEYSNNPSTNGAWHVNSVGGLALSGYFNLTATMTSTYQLSISNQTNVGTVIGVNFADFIINNAALILNSVTSGANSRMNNTAVALNDQVATLKLTGLWTITSSTSFTGVGVLDLTAALPTNGFALPSTHTNNTINVAAGATLLATGGFSQVTLSSAGSYVVDRQNAEGVMDIKALNGETVTLKNGKFRIAQGRAIIILVSAELTIVGNYGGSISGDADSTIIIDSTTIVKPPAMETDGDVRFWNYPYTLLGGPNAGKGVFFEKKSQITLYRTDSLNSATTVDDATLNIDSTFVFGVPITIQNNGIVYFNQGAELDVTFANVSFSSGGQIINSVPITLNSSCIFGTKGAKSGQFLSYSAIVVSNNVTFTTDQLVLKENASLTVEASSFVSASSLYLAPSTWLDFAGTIDLATDFINDGHVYWGGKDTVGNSVLTGTYAQNANGTTFLTVNYLNGTHAEGKFDTLTVTGDVYLFGTLQVDFANPTEALALPDQAWYPIMSVSGVSGGVFDKLEHNLGADVTLSLCFTASQGILVFNHNSTTSTVEFEDLPDGCDFVNPVPVAAPVDFASPTGSEPDSSRISSAVAFVASYIVLLFSFVVLTVC